MEKVFTISTDWQGQVGICTSYDMAYQTLAEYVKPDDLDTLLTEQLAFIEEVPLDKIYY